MFTHVFSSPTYSEVAPTDQIPILYSRERYITKYSTQLDFAFNIQRIKGTEFKMPDIRNKTFFRTLQKFKTDYSPCTITQYESERTGMRAIVADRKGPKVRGFFALATEIHDDSGARE
jgi:hypothetical protein